MESSKVVGNCDKCGLEINEKDCYRWIGIDLYCSECFEDEVASGTIDDD